MKYRSNAHTHTTYCDGLSTLDMQLSAAQKLDFVSLGFSGHAMQGFDWQYCMSVEGQRAYLAELRCIQDKLAEWSLAPRVYAGLEQDAHNIGGIAEAGRANCRGCLGIRHIDRHAGSEEFLDRLNIPRAGGALEFLDRIGVAAFFQARHRGVRS